jgi:hypothetical protein
MKILILLTESQFETLFSFQSKISLKLGLELGLIAGATDELNFTVVEVTLGHVVVEVTLGHVVVVVKVVTSLVVVVALSPNSKQFV